MDVRNPFNGQILEGLIKSQPLGLSVSILKKELLSDKNVLSINSEEGKRIRITISNPDWTAEEFNLIKYISGSAFKNETLITKILQLTNNLGYYPSYLKSYNTSTNFQNHLPDISEKYGSRVLRKILEECRVLVLFFERKFDE